MKMNGYEVQGTLGTLMALTGKKLPIKLSFAIKCNIDELAKWSQKLDEQRIELCDRYAKKDEDGKPTIENGQYILDDAEGFQSEFAELMAETIDIEVRTVSDTIMDTLDDPRYDALSVGELAGIQFIFASEE